MIEKIKLGPRILIAFLALGIIPLLVAVASSLMKASTALHEVAHNNLRELKGFNMGWLAE